MKKYLYLLMMVVCMGFVSCGDDGDDGGKGGSGNVSVLNGTWTYFSQSSSSDTGIHSFIFNNGTVKYINSYQKFEGNYSLNKEEHTLKITWQRYYNLDDKGNWKLTVEENEEMTLNYVVQGIILKIVGGGSTVFYGEYTKEI